MLPRKGDTITVLPYGPGIVEKNIGEGAVLVTVDRMFKRPDGSFTNQIVARVHAVYVSEGVLPA